MNNDNIHHLPPSDHYIAKLAKKHGRIRPSQFVLVVTEPNGSKAFYGPFGCEEDAMNFADTEIPCPACSDCWVTVLDNPWEAEGHSSSRDELMERGWSFVRYDLDFGNGWGYAGITKVCAGDDDGAEG
jgi:hypothetical protein